MIDERRIEGAYPQIYETVSDLQKIMDGEVERFCVQKMLDLNIDPDVVQLQAMEIQRLRTLLREREWIPVLQRLPDAEDGHGFVRCNVTIMRNHWPTSSYDSCDSPYDEYLVMDAMYDTSQKIWHLGDSCQLNALLDVEDSPLNGDYVIAWMPLPEAYKGE